MESHVDPAFAEYEYTNVTGLSFAPPVVPQVVTDLIRSAPFDNTEVVGISAVPPDIDRFQPIGAIESAISRMAAKFCLVLVAN